MQVNKPDWLVFKAALFCVASLGSEIGLAIAVGLSIAIVLYKTAFPHTAVLGRLLQTLVYRSALGPVLQTDKYVCCGSAFPSSVLGLKNAIGLMSSMAVT